MLPLFMSDDENKKDLEVLWTPQQVAKYLTVNPVTVYRWISKKLMFDPAKVIRFSNKVRIPRSEVERIAGSIRGKLKDSVNPN